MEPRIKSHKFNPEITERNSHTKIFVGGLTDMTDEKDIRDNFIRFGDIKKVDMKN